jgi:bis(5'-nucleosidyl)-tetraphosphatase
MKDISYGIIPLIKMHNTYKFLVLLHSHGMFWGFPKGHAELCEEPFLAAQRELYEETQLKVVQCLEKKPLIERYSFIKNGIKIDKEVFFYICHVEGSVFIDGKEIVDYRLCEYKDALALLTYTEVKQILLETKPYLEKLFC